MIPKMPKDKKELKKWKEKYGEKARWLLERNGKNLEKINLSEEEEPMKPMRKEFFVKDLNEEDRSFTGIASNESKDRDGDIIMANGWDLKNFKKNPVFLWAHNYDALPIGKVTEITKDGGELRYKVVFPEKGKYSFADSIFDLYKDKFLRAVSVGFKPIKSEDLDDEDDDDDGKDKGFFRGRRYLKQELLEISGVPVPSNFQALADKRFKEMVQKTEKGNWEAIEQKDGDYEMYAEVLKPLPNEHSCRLKDPAQYKTCRRTTRTTDGKKYSIITCQRKDDETKWEEQAFRYNKDTWTAAQARSHCKKHEGTFEAAKNTDPEQLKEICLPCNEKPKMEKDDLVLPLKLDDKMIEMLKILKSGRVISEKNRKVINTAITSMSAATVALKNLLVATEPAKPEEDDGKSILEQVKETQERINSLESK